MAYFHRIAYVRNTGEVLCAGTTTTPLGRTLIQPLPITDHSRGEPFVALVVPMDDAPHIDHWLRLQAEWHHSYYPEGHKYHGTAPVGDVKRCMHHGGTPHDTLPHVLFPGAFEWTEPAHPRVQQHIDFLHNMSSLELIKYFSGLEPEPMGHFHKDCKLRLRHVQLTLQYDLSINCEIFADVIGPDGKDTELKHGYGHRIPPNKWHALNVPELVREALDAHHAALGLTPPEEAPIHLHPAGHPGVNHYAPVPEKPKRDVPSDFESQVREHVDREKHREMGLLS